jgi:hypothetical protein
MNVIFPKLDQLCHILSALLKIISPFAQDMPRHIIFIAWSYGVKKNNWKNADGSSSCSFGLIWTMLHKVMLHCPVISSRHEEKAYYLLMAHHFIVHNISWRNNILNYNPDQKYHSLQRRIQDLRKEGAPKDVLQILKFHGLAIHLVDGTLSKKPGYR